MDNDYYPTFEDDCNWESSLDDIIKDNKDIFASYDIEMVEAVFLKDIKLSDDLFFDGKYGYFPVFSKKDSIMEVIKYDDIDKQNQEYGFNKNIVNDKILKLLEKADDYDVVQLQWRLGTEYFKSLALFDRLTGELEYDNLLFNMTTIAKYDAEKFILILRSSETPASNYSGSRTVNHYLGMNLVATASVDWYVYGHWNTNTYLSKEDEYNYYYTTYYTFCYDSARINTSHSEVDGFDTFVDARNNSVVLQPRFEIEYALWAGPVECFDFYDYNLHYMGNTEMQRRVLAGSGIYELIQQSPYREPVELTVEK